MMVPAAGTHARMLFDVRRSIEDDRRKLQMRRADRDDMIARLWATQTLDTVDIALACGCREATVAKVLHRQREARR